MNNFPSTTREQSGYIYRNWSLGSSFSLFERKSKEGNWKHLTKSERERMDGKWTETGEEGGQNWNWYTWYTHRAFSSCDKSDDIRDIDTGHLESISLCLTDSFLSFLVSGYGKIGGENDKIDTHRNTQNYYLWRGEKFLLPKVENSIPSLCTFDIGGGFGVKCEHCM